VAAAEGVRAAAVSAAADHLAAVPRRYVQQFFSTHFLPACSKANVKGRRGLASRLCVSRFLGSKVRKLRTLYQAPSAALSTPCFCFESTLNLSIYLCWENASSIFGQRSISAGSTLHPLWVKVCADALTSRHVSAPAPPHHMTTPSPPPLTIVSLSARSDKQRTPLYVAPPPDSAGMVGPRSCASSRRVQHSPLSVVHSSTSPSPVVAAAAGAGFRAEGLASRV